MKKNFIFFMLIFSLLLLAGCKKVDSYIEKFTKTKVKVEYKISNCEVGYESDVLNSAVEYFPLTLNPLKAMDPVSKKIASKLTFTLLLYNPITDTYESGLLKDFTTLEGNKEFTLNLRRNIKFSNGEIFTSDDLLATVDLIMKSDFDSPIKPYLMVNGTPFIFTKIDKFNVKLISKYPIFNIKPILSRIPVLPASIINKYSNNLDKLYAVDSPIEDIVSIGPYKVLEFSKAKKQIILGKNENFWILDRVGNSLPYIQKIVFNVIGQVPDLTSLFKRGEIDIVENILPEDAKRLEEVKGINIYEEKNSAGGWFLWFNCNKNLDPETKEAYVPSYKLSWFCDKNFRNGVNMLINRDVINNTIFSGTEETYENLISSLNVDFFGTAIFTKYNRQSAINYFYSNEYKLDRSKGTPIMFSPDKNPVAINLLVRAGSYFDETIASLFEGDFSDVGLKTVMLQVPFDLFYSKIFSTYNYDAVLTYIPDEAVSPYFMKSLLYSSSPYHLWAPKNNKLTSKSEKKIDSLCDLLYTSADYRKQVEAFGQICKIMQEEKFFIPVIRGTYFYGAKGKVKNVKVNFRTPDIFWNCYEFYIVGE